MNASYISDKDLYLRINEVLLSYALSLPVHVSYGDTLKIYELLQQPNKNIIEIVSSIERVVMQPHGRSVWVENRLFLIPQFKDICPIVDYAYIAYSRGNHIGAYFSLLPVVEGIILRWMGYIDRKDNERRKPTFSAIKRYINDKKNDDQLLNSHTFVSIWIETVSSILCDEFFQETWKGHTLDYFNRHAGGHLLKLFSLVGIKGLVMRIFIIIELLVEIYVVENKYRVEGAQIPLLFKTCARSHERFRAYKISYDWLLKDLRDHPEAILKSLYN